MNAYLKPFHLVKGHNYKVSYGDDTKTVYRLIKASKTGYKFLNLRTNTCGQQQIMYPSKEPNYTKNFETWFWLPANMVIIEIPLADMEIGICNTCNQMTNHRDGMCLKCTPKEENVPDFYEAKEHQNYKLLPRQPMQLRIYKHQDLINEFNELMIKIKKQLYNLPYVAGDVSSMPTNEELDSTFNKIMAVLREDSKPMVKH